MSDAADSVGAMATGGLIAREIERAHRGAPAIGHDEDEPCGNCGTERVGPYCHACGQAGHIHRNLAALVHDIAHGVFHFEGKMWNTLPLLGWRPGELTRRYVHGERAKFVSPMALFLFSVFLMFAVLSNLGHHAKPHGDKPASKISKTEAQRSELETKIATYKSLRDTLPGEASRKKMEAKIAAAEHDLNALAVPAKIEAITTPGVNSRERAQLEENGFGTGFGWFDNVVSHTAKNPELAAYKLKSYGYKYSWALIPISLPFLWLLFCFRRDVGLYDHAIFAIYSLSFMSLAAVVLFMLGWIGVSMALIWAAVLIVPPVHMYRQLKGAYGLGRWGAGWRTVALLIITSITSSLFLSFLIWMGSD
jgi:hypothetical protein